jgi:hypothetical protein
MRGYAPQTSKGFVAPSSKNLLLVSNGLLAKFGLWQARRPGTAERLERLAAEKQPERRAEQGQVATPMAPRGCAACWARYSLRSTRAGGVRVAASPGRAAITAAAVSQPAAMMSSAVSGMAITGVMPS